MFPHNSNCPLCAETARSKRVFFRGVPADTLSRDELLIAYRHVVTALEQSRDCALEDAEMQSLFTETARAIRSRP